MIIKMENSVNKEAFKGNVDTNIKDKNGFYDFNKVDVFDISKARANTKRLSYPKMYEYANRIAEVINKTIRSESEKGNTRCGVFINFEDIFGESEVKMADYNKILDYITGLYSVKGYDIAAYTSRMVTKTGNMPIHRSNIFLKIYIGWK